jgi:hypothetical protein
VSAEEGGFTTSSFVLVTLNAPREKFWGVVVALSTAGVTVRGVDLNSYEEVARQVRAGEPVGAATVFFPMHRVERVEMDEAVGELPSLTERFRALSGHDAASVFATGA